MSFIRSKPVVGIAVKMAGVFAFLCLLIVANALAKEIRVSVGTDTYDNQPPVRGNFASGSEVIYLGGAMAL